MPGKAPERFIWAVDTLEIRPADRLLEVGSGHGVAGSLGCGRLPTGAITAIDRSPKMIEMATRRNREHVDAGKAVLEAVALEDADLGDRRFDKVFAFNVAPFWQQPEAALAAVREHLVRDGAVYLFWDARHSAPERRRDPGNELPGRLHEGGFSVERVLVEDLRPVPAVCAIGRPRGGEALTATRCRVPMTGASTRPPPSLPHGTTTGSVDRVCLRAERYVDGDHRRPPGVDGVDDLRAVDALQVDRSDPEVRVPELTLDHDERDAFAGHLDGVSMAELVWRESPPPAGSCGGVAQLGACGAG